MCECTSLSLYTYVFAPSHVDIDTYSSSYTYVWLVFTFYFVSFHAAMQKQCQQFPVPEGGTELALQSHATKSAKHRYLKIQAHNILNKDLFTCALESLVPIPGAIGLLLKIDLKR